MNETRSGNGGRTPVAPKFGRMFAIGTVGLIGWLFLGGTGSGRFCRWSMVTVFEDGY